MIPTEQIKFIQTIAPIVQKYCKERGYKFASPIIAQATVESFKNDGLSQLAKTANNFFGMKGDPKYWKGETVTFTAHEEKNGKLVAQPGTPWRKYADMDSGVKGYFDFINTKRYACLKNAKSPQNYLELIKACGYATSSKYVQTNMQRIVMYNLTQYDNFSTIIPSTVKGYEVGKTYTLQANMYVRQSPNGEKLKFDNLTEDGKKHGHFDDEGNAILNEGTRVTCKEISVVGSQTWLKIPSGWVCAIGQKTYIV